ncbi:MAG: hypothetical protein U1E14_09970 [Geminicoccaceae bacterium]
MAVGNGTDRGEVLRGSGNIDTLAGRGGNDTLYGLVGIDRLYGGDESDLLFGGETSDTLFGGNENDKLVAGNGNDRAFGGNDSDFVFGGSGNDLVYGGEVVDVLYGGEGNDFLFGGNGADSLFAGSGVDLLIGGAGADKLVGDGDDLASYAPSRVGVAIDLAAGIASGGDGAGDSLTGIRDVIGSSAEDEVAGDDADNRIAGLDGGDTLDGAGGDDTLAGGNGADSATGGVGDDLLAGDEGDDSLGGGAGSDSLAGGNGDDQLAGDADDDLLAGDAGNDTLTGGSGEDQASGDVGDDSIDGSAGNDSLFGGDDDDDLAGGDGRDTLFGGNGDDILAADGPANAGAAVDLLFGGSGADTLRGGIGDDALSGGADADRLIGNGDDTAVYVVSAARVVIDLADGTGAGGDAAGDSLSGIANVTGSALDDILRGSSGANGLTGGEGDDTLDGAAGADVLDGGTGNDFYIVDSASDRIIEAADGGTDTIRSFVNFELSEDLEVLVLSGGGDLDGTGNRFENSLVGNAGDNRLDGSNGSDTLEGEGGNDVLIGGTAVDRLVGGTGNDLYVVDTINDVVVEAIDEGFDTVRSSASFDLVGGIESLVLTGSEDLRGSGTSLANTLTGNDGANLLDGSSGDDVVSGGDGADSVEGAAGSDSLFGGAGNDVLSGGSGADTIDGGAGTDIAEFTGNLANYRLTNLGNGVVSVVDLLATGVGDDGTARLVNVELLRFRDGTISSDINRAPGAIGDTNAAANRVFEAAANGSTVGITARSNDPDGDSVTYSLSEDAGGRFAINASTGVVTVKNGALLTAGQTHSITVVAEDPDGLEVEETFQIGVVTDGNAPVANADRILMSRATEFAIPTSLLVANDTDPQGDRLNITAVSGQSGCRALLDGDVIRVEVTGATATFAYTLSDGSRTSTASVTITGTATTSGDDRLEVASTASLPSFVDGLGGDDEIVGSTGADSFFGGSGNDELSGAASSDRLSAGSGNDLVDGGSGADTMIGASGDDVFVVDSAGDVVIEASGEGTDTIRTGLSVSLDDAIENLEITGSGNASGTGNRLLNVLVGNAGDNRLDGDAASDTLSGGSGDDTLDGGTAADRLEGGSGNDTFFVDTINDEIVEASGDGTDVARSTVSYTLVGSVEGLVLLGSDSIDATGNSIANTLVGNAGANKLDGKSEDDLLFGGNGNDSLLGDTGTDTVYGGAGNDFLSGGSGADTLDGGAGSDTAVFTGNRENYQITGLGSGIVTVVDLFPGGVGDDGTARLVDVEWLRFLDGTYANTANRAPGAISDASNATDRVEEQSANGTTVGITARSVDPDGDKISFSLSDDAGGRFAINASTGVVTVKNGSLLDYAAAKSHTITVRASDPDGLFVERDYTIAVTDVPDPNRAPGAVSDASAVANSVAEKSGAGTVVGITARSIDPDGDSVTYSLTDDAGGRFAINATTGVVTVKNGALLDYGQATSHGITVRASDPDGLFVERDFTVAVTDVPDPNRAPGAIADANAGGNSVAEQAANGTAVGITARSTDPDGDSLTYSLSDDAGGRFAINATTGVVTVKNGSLLDFGQATSHTIMVRASDPDGLYAERAYTIAVTDVPDPNRPPGSVSDGDATVNRVNAGAPAGTAVGITARSTDPDGDSVTYSLADDAGGRFVINAATGVVTVKSGAQLSGGAEHDIVVRATDPDGLFAERTFTIDVAASGPTPTAGADQLIVSRGTALAVPVTELLANDSAGSGATLSITGVTAGSGITVTLAGGVISIVANSAGGSFTYTLSDGEDTATGTVSVEGVTTSAGNDLLTLASTATKSSYINALAGNDTVTGGTGDDTIEGGDGRDVLTGGVGNDWLSANEDTTTAIVESDTLFGGAGDDTMFGRAGNDTIDGGIGNDFIRGEYGTDTVWGGDGNDSIHSDNAYGGSGDDGLFGGGGDDKVFGGEGSDTLSGDANADTLYGGSGADIFYFRYGPGQDGGAGDLVADFSAGDVIDVSQIDAISGGDNQAFTFIGNAQFTAGVAGQLRWSTSGDGSLLIEMNTNFQTSSVEGWIIVQGVTSLSAADFLL